MRLRYNNVDHTEVVDDENGSIIAWYPEKINGPIWKASSATFGTKPAGLSWHPMTRYDNETRGPAHSRRLADVSQSRRRAALDRVPNNQSSSPHRRI